MAGKKVAARAPAKKAQKKKAIVKQDREAIGGPKHPRVDAAGRIYELGRQVHRAMKPGFTHGPVSGTRAQRAERKLEAACRAYLKLPKFNGERYDSIVKAEKLEKSKLERVRVREAEKEHRVYMKVREAEKEHREAQERAINKIVPIAEEPIDTKDKETDEEDGRSVEDSSAYGAIDESE